MPDICMCYAHSCPKKESCYRAMAIPNEYRQSYFLIEPLDEDGKCEYYSPVRLGDFIVKE